MANTLKLSDILMMQMVGGLEEFVDHVNSGTLPDDYIERIRSQATTATIFSEIVRKAITTQFGNPLTSLRELGQNARDSYRSDEEKKTIDFLLETRKGRQFISVRDEGIGMSPQDVFTMFLVPYNSKKENDPEKIGVHGIGFFSNLDISDQVLVTTRNGCGNTTKLDMHRQNEDWSVDYEISDTAFKGTKVELRLRKEIPKGDVYRALVKDLGFLNSGFVVSYNKRKLNQIPDFYEGIATSVVTASGRSEQLSLGFAGKDLNERPFFKNADCPGNLVMTQKGFYIREPPISELIEDVFLEDFVKRMTNVEFNFWLDLPNNVELTKGRNNVIAKDYNAVTTAATDAFSQGLLSLLENKEVVYEMDSQLAELVDRILGLKVSEKTFSFRELGSRLSDVYHFLHDTELHFSFKDFVLNFKSLSDQEDSTQDKEEQTQARRRKILQVSNYTKITGFSGELIKKKMIPAINYDVDTPNRTKISVLDVIDLYLNENLRYSVLPIDSKLEMFVAQGTGTYVDRYNPIINRVINHVEEKLSKKMDRTDFSVDLKRIWSHGLRGFGEFFGAIKESVQTFQGFIGDFFLSDEEHANDFRRTKRESFERIAAKFGVGTEYLTFFDNLEYIDSLISQASGNHYVDMRLFGEECSSQIAHTNRLAMGFNVYNSTVERYLGAIRKGEYDEPTFRSLVEVVLHEKAHDVMGFYSPLWDHGKEFYCKVKKGLREQLYDYCKQNGIDPYEKINADLKQVNSEELSPERLKSLLKGKDIRED